MKVAICSSDGAKVDLHFGKTSSFYIFDFSNGRKELIDHRSVESYCPSSEKGNGLENQHAFSKEKFEKVYQSICDCDKIFTVAVGETPKKKLEEKGIGVELCMCDISWIPTQELKNDKSNTKYYLS